jgi:hypothetical protein
LLSSTLSRVLINALEKHLDIANELLRPAFNGGFEFYESLEELSFANIDESQQLLVVAREHTDDSNVDSKLLQQ